MELETKTGAGEFVISHTIAIPRERVWDAYTERRHLMRWWGPKGFVMTHCTIDLRPGGAFHYGMRSPNGQEMWGKLTYREIVAPEILDFVVSFSDANGGVTRHPMAPTWPLETLSRTTFAEADGKTAVTVRWAPYNATDEETRTFEAGRDSMRAGPAASFSQLEDYLRSVS
ncbi:MAG TPA: SRPBCC domain-containing protein [Xanthobacteraceae bacterium]|nr:SRPBCC domain-containing protein [Xanthobacteraceae bacterium]